MGCTTSHRQANFPSPIPVNEEQRKIIKAVNDSNSKYITVEGPPGTGKNHKLQP